MALTNKSTTKKRQSRNKNFVTDEMVRSPWFWVGLVILGLIYFFFLRDSGNEKKKATIDETPTCITSIKEIAEWEFLTLQIEEFVDTTVNKKLSSAQAVKIYKGTARLGINTKKANKNWIVCEGEKATITLPEIELLDKSIIDDTQTRTFYETGTISATVKEKMLQSAKKKMKATALQKENIAIAEENAKTEFKNIFTALGYKTVQISFKK
ncbi:MAG: DUF4230 domain-containing protein [Paludibacteraceae bacterium]|nr:DUF4230 domain-containing protein [Paludibacteraceae bacterium]